MEEKDRFKKSQEAEKKRYRFEMKYSKQLEEARAEVKLLSRSLIRYNCLSFTITDENVKN